MISGRFACGEQLDRRVDRLPIDPFAIDAEAPHRPNRPAIQPAVLKQMPARHHMKMARRFDRQPAHRQRIGRARMIGRDQNRMSRRERCPQPLDMPDLMRDDAFVLPQVIVVNRESSRKKAGQNVPRYGGKN